MITTRSFRILLRNRTQIQVCSFYQKSNRAKNSPAVVEQETNFGSLADKLELKSNKFLPPQKFKTLEELEDHDGESEHFAKISDTSRPRPGDFERKIEDLLSKRHLAKALKVFDEEMPDEAVKPNAETYKLLIHACGKAGNAFKARDLLNRFRHGNRATYGMFANTFHACANAPAETKESCLKIAHSVRNILSRETQAPLPAPLYNTMIAAFGRCGDTETAFAIIDEMSTKGVRIDYETFNHLLQACISDRDSGFRLALTVYRRLLNKRISPSIQTFNLVLKATKDCGVGDTDVANDLLIEAMTSKEVRKFKQKLLEERKDCDKTKDLVDNSDEASVKLVPSAQSEVMLSGPVHPQLPNLLSKKPVMEYIMGLSASQLNSNFNSRLQLLGNIDGFIEVIINEFKVDVDIKTLSALIPFTDSDEKEEMLMSYLKKLNIKPDVDFFNQLMRQKVARKDNEGKTPIYFLCMNRSGPSGPQEGLKFWVGVR